jgi:RHS repeat-associated protein
MKSYLKTSAWRRGFVVWLLRACAAVLLASLGELKASVATGSGALGRTYGWTAYIDFIYQPQISGATVFWSKTGDDITFTATGNSSLGGWRAKLYMEANNFGAVGTWTFSEGGPSVTVHASDYSNVLPFKITMKTGRYYAGEEYGEYLDEVVVWNGTNGTDTSGTIAANKLAKYRRSRDGTGGQVLFASGAEEAERPLFSFKGARNWDFGLHYNSILATAQTAPTAAGYGWTHDFEKSIEVSGTDLIVHWNAGSANVFNPVSGSPGSFASTEDASRYDTLVAQGGGGWLLTRRDQTSFLFNASGQLIEDRDAHGRKLNLTYTSGKLTSITDPVSSTSLTLAYDGSGTISTLTDGTSASVGLSYTSVSSKRILSQITNQNSKHTTLAYDSSLNLLTLTDHNGAVLTTNVYDTNGHVDSQDDGVTGNQDYHFSYIESGMAGDTLFAASDTSHLVPLVLTDPQTLSATNSLGQTVTYTRNGNGRLATATLAGQTTTVSYDPANSARIISITDPSSNVTTVPKRTYVTVTDRTGQSWRYVFDSEYNKLSSTNPLNQTTTYTYDGSNQLTSVTDALSQTSSYTYDSRGNVLTATDPAGKTTTNTYDSHNNLLTTTDPLSHVTTLTYDSNNNLLTSTDALSHTTTWTYDANSLPLTKTLPGGGVYHYTYTAGQLTQVSDPNSVVTNFSYDANGLLLYQEDALGKRTTYTYDAIGNVLTVTDALSHVTTYTYDHRNRLTSVTDPTSAVTSYTYDNNNNLLTTTNPLSKVTTSAYDGEDRLLTVTDPLSRVTTKAYDTAGRLLSITDPASHVVSYEYDAAGQLTAMVDALGKRTTTTYNSRGLRTGVTDPLSRTTSFTYDDAGRRLTAVDPLTRTNTFAYDAVNRLTQVTDPGSLVSQQGYDGDGNRTSLTNPATQATALAYDVGDRLTTTTTPAGHATSLTYDSRGLLASVTEPSTQATTFAYDDAAQLSSTTDAVGTITYTRDADGRILTEVENSKTITRVYDAHGRLTSYTDGDGNVIGYTYDDLDRLTRITYPDSKQVNYAYDSTGRLYTVTDWASRVTTYSYDAANRLTQTLRPNGTKQLRGYDDAGQLTSLVELAPDGVTVLYAATPTWDSAGQLTRELLNPIPTPVTTNVTQTFNADNRLLTHNAAAVTFDADGNLLTVVSGVSPASYTYDARNRLTAAGSLTYGYDAENHRVAVTDGSGTTQYAINPNADLDQVLVRTASGGTKTFYVYGLGLLHEETGSTVRYYHGDRRGDTVLLTDGTGAVTDRMSYGIYGEPASRAGSTNTPFLFNGIYGVQTDSNGLTYHRARYYHAGLRRLLNQDSILGDIGAGASLNRFAYANGCPVSLIDPYGLAAQDANPNGRYGWTRKLPKFVREIPDMLWNTDKGYFLLMDFGSLYQDVKSDPEGAIEDAVMMYVLHRMSGGGGIRDALRNVSDGIRAWGWGTAEKEGINLQLQYKAGWTPKQITAADAKVAALNDSDMVVTKVERSGTSASSRYRRAGGSVPVESDVDHTHDLQLGGQDELFNMAPLNSSVNRSLGAQIQSQIKNLPPGTTVDSITIGH